VVEGGNASQVGHDPFFIACADENLAAAGELSRYAATLRAAGWQVVADPEDEQVLQIWRG
jgi:hypothetical protein